MAWLRERRKGERRREKGGRGKEERRKRGGGEGGGGNIGERRGRGFYTWDTPEQQAALRHKEAALRDLVAYLEARGPEAR